MILTEHIILSGGSTLGNYLKERMENLPEDFSIEELSTIQEKLGIITPAIVVIEEGGIKGYVTQHRKDNPQLYGNIGEQAIDFSTNFSESNTHGATGYYSFATGGITTASGAASAAFGALTTASGDQAISTGYETTASGLSTYSMGQWTEAKSFIETARGFANESPTPNSTNNIHPNDLVESVGGGVNKSNRKNLFARYKSGAFYWNKITDFATKVTNAVKGFHAADKDGILNFFNGNRWLKYKAESIYLGFDTPLAGTVTIDVNDVSLGQTWTVDYNDTNPPTFELSDGSTITTHILENTFDAATSNRILIKCVDVDAKRFDIEIKKIQ